MRRHYLRQHIGRSGLALILAGMLRGNDPMQVLSGPIGRDDPDDGWLTAKRAAREAKVERVTASRDLARLEELGVIEKDPGVAGRSTRYRVRLGEERPIRLVEDMAWVEPSPEPKAAVPPAQPHGPGGAPWAEPAPTR